MGATNVPEPLLNAIWQGGMSFHGGLIGVVIAGWLFTRINKCDFWKLSDIIIVTVPIRLGLGRLANFINGELYGGITQVLHPGKSSYLY